MLNFLKDRILLFVLILAGDYVSLSNLIKANEIRADAVTIAIVVSLIPTLLISLLVHSLFNRRKKKFFIKISVIVAAVLWTGFIISFLDFNKVNNKFGKVPFPVNHSVTAPVDSFIVGGCLYTPEAQKEVDFYSLNKRTLTPQQLFADFNYVVSKIWEEKDVDCARTKILTSFAIMLLFLMTGITLLCELLIALIKPDKPK